MMLSSTRREFFRSRFAPSAALRWPSRRLLARIAGPLVASSALLIAACGPTDEPAQEPSAALEETRSPADSGASGEEPVERQPILPDTPLPSEPGLFRVGQGRLVGIPSADPSTPHPTNAERGFGFTEPQGPLVRESRPLFVLRGGALDHTTLRLTRFAPDALLPARWWERSGEPGRSGWLPHGIVRLDVEPVPGESDVVRLQPAEPLVPGFYVLHDGSLLRARRRAELTTFFAFEASPRRDGEPSADEQDEQDAAAPAATGEALWFEQASRCLREIEGLVIEAHRVEEGASGLAFDRESLTRTHGARLRHCARQIHTVLDASRAGGAVEAQARTVLLTLSTIARGVPYDVLHEVLNATEPRSGPAAALLAYWLDQEALITALELRRALAAGRSSTAGALAAKLAALYEDARTSADLEDADDAALTRLLWIPWFLDERWPSLAPFAQQLAAGRAPWDQAALLLAAHRAQRLRRFAKRYPDSPLGPLAEASVRDLPADVLEAAGTLDTSSSGTASVVLPGAAVVLVPTQDDVGVRDRVDRWLRAQQRAMVRCYEALEKRAGGARQGMVLLQLDIDESFLGGGSRVSVLEPPAPGGSTRERSSDDELASCLQTRALAEIPTGLSRTSTRVVVPLAFGGLAARPRYR